MQPSRPLLPRLISSHRLRFQIFLGYAAVLSLFLIIGILAAVQFNRMNQANAALEHETEAALAAEELSRAVLDMVIKIDEGILLQDSTRFTLLVPQAQENVRQRQEEVRRYFEEIAPLEFALARLNSFIDPMVVQAQNNTWNIIESNRLTRMGESITGLSVEVDQLAEQARNSQDQALQRAVAARQSFISNLLITFIVAIIFSGIALYATQNLIARRVGKLAAVADRLAAGDLTQRVIPESDDELGALADAFNRMAAQLESTYAQLETRVNQRTAEYQQLTARMRTSAEIAAAVAAFLDLELLGGEPLPNRIVNLIAERFNLYHAAIYMLDEQDSAVLTAAYSATAPESDRLQARNFRLKAGQGVAGQAIQKAQPYVVQDTTDNQALIDRAESAAPPNTRAEVALPLRARGAVIGALDLHSDTPHAFPPDFISVLQTLADQVALAIDNARLYRESQQRLKEVRRLYGQYAQVAWRETVQNQPTLGYRYHKELGLRPLNAQAALAPASNELAPDTDLYYPVLLRDQQIATLHLRKPGDSAWSEIEMDVIAALSAQIGLALESARLFADTQRQAQREHLIGQITARVRASLDLETVLQTTLREIGQTLDLAKVELRLGPPNERHEQE